MASFLAQQVLEIALRGHPQEGFHCQAFRIVGGGMVEDADNRFTGGLFARHRVNTRMGGLQPGNQRLEKGDGKVGRCHRIAHE